MISSHSQSIERDRSIISLALSRLGKGSRLIDDWSSPRVEGEEANFNSAWVPFSLRVCFILMPICPGFQRFRCCLHGSYTSAVYPLDQRQNIVNIGFGGLPGALGTWPLSPFMMGIKVSDLRVPFDIDEISPATIAGSQRHCMSPSHFPEVVGRFCGEFDNE